MLMNVGMRVGGPGEIGGARGRAWRAGLGDSDRDQEQKVHAIRDLERSSDLKEQ